jgi:hypothetical protein
LKTCTFHSLARRHAYICACFCTMKHDGAPNHDQAVDAGATNGCRCTRPKHYLKPRRLGKSSKHSPQSTNQGGCADYLRLLALTGARKTETLNPPGDNVRWNHCKFHFPRRAGRPKQGTAPTGATARCGGCVVLATDKLRWRPALGSLGRALA